MRWRIVSGTAGTRTHATTPCTISSNRDALMVNGRSIRHERWWWTLKEKDFFNTKSNFIAISSGENFVSNGCICQVSALRSVRSTFTRWTLERRTTFDSNEKANVFFEKKNKTIFGAESTKEARRYTWSDLLCDSILYWIFWIVLMCSWNNLFIWADSQRRCERGSFVGVWSFDGGKTWSNTELAERREPVEIKSSFI